jgi:hypothetical protein
VEIYDLSHHIGCGGGDSHIVRRRHLRVQRTACTENGGKASGPARKERDMDPGPLGMEARRLGVAFGTLGQDQARQGMGRRSLGA